MRGEFLYCKRCKGVDYIHIFVPFFVCDTNNIEVSVVSTYRHILIEMLSRHECKVKVEFENLQLTSADVIVEMTCYHAIKRIREILNDSSLDDFACIEEIVLILEDIGIGCGSRHDF